MTKIMSHIRVFLMIFDRTKNVIAMRHNSLTLVMIFSITLSGCGGSGGSSSTEAGISIGISAQPQPSPNSDSSVTALPAGAKIFSNSEDVQIQLTRAYLVVSSITLESNCDSSNFAKLDLRSVPRAIVNLIVPVAQAHTAASPTQTGEPIVLDLLAADLEPVDIGDLAPPAGDYCGVTANLSAADDDAVGLPTDTDMIGKTLHIEGQFLMIETTVPFTLETSVALLPASKSFDAPLMLDATHRSGDVTLEVNYQRWFDGVDMANLDDATQSDIVLGNIRDSIVAATD